MSEIICKCGHSVSEHQENGCWYFSSATNYGETPHHCECMIPEDTVIELYTLRKSNETAEAEVAFEEIQRVFKKYQEAEEPNTKAYLFKVVKIANDYLGRTKNLLRDSNNNVV